MKTKEDFLGDISLGLAVSAHQGTSFSPERRGESQRNEYAETMAGDYARLSGHADTEEKRAIFADEFERYRAGYRTRFAAYLSSKSRCVSSMIAGPSNFPARQMEKRSDVANRRLHDLVEFRERVLAAILKRLHPEWRPIMSGDDDALTRLREKLAKAEESQEKNKAVNKLVRKGDTVGLLAMGMDQETVSLLFERDFAGRIGIPDYVITNSGANIRELKKRIAKLEESKAAPTVSVETTSGIRLEDDPPANRVRLFFPGKPAEEIRTELKKNGFRWSPTIGAWQAYRNDWSIETAKKLAG